MLVLLFGILGHLIEGLLRNHSGISGLRNLASLGIDELAARVLMIVIAFLPFFAFWEIGRVIGMNRLAALFFQRRDVGSDARN